MARYKKKRKEIKPKLFDISSLFFLIVVVALPNVYYQQALDKHLDIRLFAIALFMLLLVVHFIISKKSNKQTFDFSVLKTPSVLMYFAYVIFVILSYFWATNKTEANYEILKTTTFFILFLYMILFVLPKDKSRESVVFSFIIFGLILSIVGLVQLKEAVELHGFGVKTAYLVKGNNAHKNIFSQVLFFGFTFSIYGIFLFKDIRKNIAIITALLTLVMILSLMTRSVWVALFMATVVVAIVYLIALRKSFPLKQFRKTIIAIIAVFGFTVFVVLLFTGFDSDKQFQTHIVKATKFKEGNILHRFDLWKKSIPMIKENTVLGVGAGNWKIDILKYDVTLSNGTKNIVPRRTHNDYISVLTETGVVGLLLYLGFLVLVFFSAIKFIKKSETKEEKLFGLALLFAFVGYSTYSLFSFPKERIETQIFFNIVLAFIIHRKNSQITTNKKSKSNMLKPIAAIAGVFLFFAVLSGYYRTKAEVKINKLYSLQASKNISDEEKLKLMYQLTEEALSPFSTITPFSEPIVKMQAGILYQQKADFEIVEAKYKQALVEIPYHIKTLLELSQMYYNREDFENAVLYSGEAYQYGPNNMNIIIAYSFFLKKAGNDEKAFEILKAVKSQKTDKRYQDLLYSFLNEKTINLVNTVKNKKVRQVLYNKSQDKKVLLGVFKYSFNKDILFEKEILYRSMKEVKKKGNLRIENSLDSLIQVYNIEIDF